MRAYIIRRLLLMIPTFILVTMFIFGMVRFIPGSVIDMMMTEMGESGQDIEAQRAKIEHGLGLDVPIYVQYGRWVSNMVLHGDLGVSLWQGTSVTQQILERLPVTLELGILAIIVGLSIALPIGIYSAIRQDTGGDYIARSFAILCIALPAFWVGTMVVVFPSIWWHWSPRAEYISFLEAPLENLGMFIIPGFIMGMGTSGTTMRMMRTMMLEVLRQDYIRTAWSKGLTERTVVYRHALKNAIIPVVTMIGLHMPILIGGAVIIEQIFCLPGIGRLMITALTKRDYPIISGINVFMAFWVLILNLLVDLTYAWLDPRVKYQ